MELNLVSVIITLIVVGVALYLINLIPMADPIKKILNAAVIVIVILWLLSLFLGPVGAVRIPVRR